MATSLFRKRPLAMLTAASLLPLALLTTPAFAECERGDLDTIYCDENGDMVAGAYPELMKHQRGRGGVFVIFRPACFFPDAVALIPQRDSLPVVLCVQG